MNTSQGKPKCAPISRTATLIRIDAKRLHDDGLRQIGAQNRQEEKLPLGVHPVCGRAGGLRESSVASDQSSSLPVLFAIFIRRVERTLLFFAETEGGAASMIADQSLHRRY